MQSKRLLASILVVVMVAAMLPIAAFAAEYKDIEDSWAKAEITKWSDLGVIQGSNGAFRPNASITRAEMAVIFNQVMGYTVKAANTYSDLPTDWYTDNVLRASAAGVLQGSGSTIRPMGNITRQEAAVVVCRAMGISPVEGTTAFADDAAIAAWARGYVKALADMKLVSGVAGNNYAPEAQITRASVVKMLDSAVNAYYTAAGEYTGDVTGNVVVKADGVVLKNMTINGNLIIAEGVSDGEVTLDSVKVKGETVIRGGGANSIIAKGNTELNKVTVSKTAEGAISVKVEGNAKVEVIVTENGTINVTGKVGELSVTGDVAVSLVGATVEKVNVTETAAVTVDKTSTVKEISVAAADTAINVAGTVTKVTTTEAAKGTEIKTETGAKIDTVVAQGAGTAISGEGAVSNVKADGNNVVVSTPNTKVEAGKDTTGVVVGGAEVKPGEGATTDNTGKGSTPGTGGSTGGGTGGYVPNYKSVTVYTATMADESEPANPTPVKDYSVVGKRYNATPEYVTVEISATDLAYHKNDAMGHWIGFAIEAPEGASKVKFVVDAAANGGALSAAQAVEANIGGVGKKGISLYTNAGAADVKTYARVEWYAEDGTTKIGETETYKMDLSRVSLVNKVSLKSDETAAGLALKTTGISEAGGKTTYQLTLSGAVANSGFKANDGGLDFVNANGLLAMAGQKHTYITLAGILPVGTNTDVKQVNPALMYYTFDRADSGIAKEADNWTKTKTYTISDAAADLSFAVLPEESITLTVGNDIYVITNTVTVANAPTASAFTPEDDLTIVAGAELTVANGKTLTIDTGRTLINNGAIVNNGVINGEGTITNNGKIGVGVNAVTGEKLAGTTASLEIAAMTNNGVAYVGGSLTVNTLTQAAGGQIVVNGGALAIGETPVKTFDIAGDAKMEFTGVYTSNSFDKIKILTGTVTLLTDYTVRNSSAAADITVGLNTGDVAGTLVVPEGKTLTIESGANAYVNAKGVLEVNGTLANSGILAGAGTINLAEGKSHTGTAISGVVFSCINNKATWDTFANSLGDDGKAALGVWGDENTPLTMPWVAVKYTRASAGAVTLTIVNGETTITDTLEAGAANVAAFFTRNSEENTGLDAGTYTVTLKMVVDGLTTTMTKDVEVAVPNVG